VSDTYFLEEVNFNGNGGKSLYIGIFTVNPKIGFINIKGIGDRVKNSF
jgi:hypothetical protein